MLAIWSLSCRISIRISWRKIIVMIMIMIISKKIGILSCKSCRSKLKSKKLKTILSFCSRIWSTRSWISSWL